MNRIVLGILIASSLVSCRQEANKPQNTIISVSIQPQKYFVERIAGDAVEVNVLIPPGASPATYEPTLAQLASLDQSELYMKIGYVGFELSWMDKISSVNPEMRIADVSKGIILIREDEEHEGHSHGHVHGGVDPHIWMSVVNAKVIAGNVYNELLLLFPEREEEMSKRLLGFTHELDSMHSYISLIMKDLEDRSFLIYHPALSYFARDYMLVQHPIEVEGKSPSPAHLKKITDLSKEKNMKTIFVQSQFDQRNAEILAQEIDAEIVRFNPLDEAWKKQMLYIVDRFKQSK